MAGHRKLLVVDDQLIGKSPTKKMEKYHITEFGALGQTGTGVTQLKDGQLQVDMQSAML
jgi:hypothetical protein